MTVIEEIISAVGALAPKALIGVRKWEDESGAERAEPAEPKQSGHRGEAVLDFGDRGKYRVVVERWNG